MQFQQLQPPLRTAIVSSGRVRPLTLPHASLNEAFAQLKVCTRFENIRHASHKAQAAVNKAKDGPGKRLGAKKSGGMSIFGNSSLPSTLDLDHLIK